MPLPLGYAEFATNLQRDISLGLKSELNLQKVTKESNDFQSLLGPFENQSQLQQEVLSFGFNPPSSNAATPFIPFAATAPNPPSLIPRTLIYPQEFPASLPQSEPKTVIESLGQLEAPLSTPQSIPDLQWGHGLSTANQIHFRSIQDASQIGGGPVDNQTLGFTESSEVVDLALSEDKFRESIRMSQFPWWIVKDLKKRGPNAIIDYYNIRAKNYRKQGFDEIANRIEQSLGQVYESYRNHYGFY